MKRIITLAAILSLVASCAPKEQWVELFDGKTLAGWAGVDGQPLGENYWAVVDGAIVSHPSMEELPAEVGSSLAPTSDARDLMTVASFSNFKLSVDFLLEEGSNGGIKYFINPGTFSGPSIGFEYQIIDDDKFGEKFFKINNVQTTASLYDILSSNKKDANFRPYEWNNATIIVDGGIVQHWLNGVKVLEIDRFSESFDRLVVNSKFAKEDGFGKLEGGHIILQDHGCRVRYKNIKIQELSGK